MIKFLCVHYCTCTYFINIWAQTARGQLDFQFLAQDFQIEEGGSQDFLIQNVSGSTVGKYHTFVFKLATSEV